MRNSRFIRTSRTGMSGAERFQMASMVGMLIILALLMGRLRDADTVRAIDRVFAPLFQGPSTAATATEPPATVDSSRDSSFSPNSSEPPNSPESPSSPALPSSSDSPISPAFEATSSPSEVASPLPDPSQEPFITDIPYDTDPAEVDRFRRNADAITDRTPGCDKYDMPAYQQLVLWSATQSFTQMAQRASRDVDYHEMTQRPELYRGRLIRLEIDARRILRCPSTDWNQNPELPLYEVWGPLPNSGARLVTAITLGLPKELQTGDQMTRLEFVGYFYKTVAYETGLSDEGRARLAPSLIGRIQAVPVQTPEITKTDYQLFWAAAGSFALIGIVAAFLARRNRRRISSSEPSIRTQQTQLWLNDKEDTK